MNQEEVKRILGEPKKIRGGYFTTWYYLNRGQVSLVSEKLDSWREPDSFSN